MTRWISPVAEKELLPPPPPREDIAAAPITALCVLAGLAFAWSAVEPMALYVAHLPLVIATILAVPNVGAGITRAQATVAERMGGSYETLILSGASGWRLVRGLVQAGVLRNLVPVALTLPAFAGCVAGLGTPPGEIAALLAVFTAWLVMINACGVLAGSGPLSAARGSRPAGAPVPPVMLPSAYALIPGVLSFVLLLPAALLAVGLPLPPSWRELVGDMVLLPFLICPTGGFAVTNIRMCGVAVPFAPLSILTTLSIALFAMVQAAPLHRQHRFDLSRQRRALTAAAHVALLFLLTAASSDGKPGPRLLVLTVFELCWMLAFAPDATAPAWPAIGPGELPGCSRLADLFRERCGTGPAFVGLLALSAAPFFAAVPPRGMGVLAFEAWLLTAVCALAWALSAFQLPTPEPVPDSGLRVRTAVVLLAVVAIAATYWNQELIVVQAPGLVAPLSLILSVSALTTPISGLLWLSQQLHAVTPPVPMANLCALLHGFPEGVYWLSVGVQAAGALAFWLRKLALTHRSG